MEINKFIFAGGLVCSLIGFGGCVILNRIEINKLNRKINDLSSVLEDHIVRSTLKDPDFKRKHDEEFKKILDSIEEDNEKREA